MKRIILFLTIIVALTLPGLMVAQNQPQSQPATELTTSSPAMPASGTMEQGMRLYRQRRYESAIAEFNRVLQSEPNNAAAHYFSGYAHYAMKHHPEAIASFKKAFQADPSFDPRPYFRR